MVRIFVSFGYTREEAWVCELVIPLLQHLGVHVIEGRDIAGKPINAEIRRRIASADALIGFLLRRGDRLDRDGSYPTSDYVRQELEIGIAQDKDVIQVVEHGVTEPGGFAKQLQRLPYEEQTRDRFLLDLARHVRAWTEGEVKVRLSPDGLVKALERDVYARKAQCEYLILHSERVEREGRAQIFPEGGGMFAKLLGFRPDTQAQVRVTVNGIQWSSTFTSYAQPFTHMELTRV